MNGFIRSGHRELIPLAEFRKWLMSIRDVPEYREKSAVMEAYIAPPRISLALAVYLGGSPNDFASSSANTEADEL